MLVPKIAGLAGIVLEVEEVAVAGGGLDLLVSLAKDDLPFPAAHREGRAGVMHGGRVGFAGLSEQNGKPVDAVFAGILRNVSADQGREGGHQVGEAEEAIAHLAGRDFVRPAGDEGDPVSAFPDAALLAAQFTSGQMAVRDFGGAFGSTWLQRSGQGAVVAGDNQESVPGQVEGLEFCGDLTDAPIHQPDHVAPGSPSDFPFAKSTVTWGEWGEDKGR